MHARNAILLCAAVALLTTAAQAQPANPTNRTLSLRIAKIAGSAVDCLFKTGTACTDTTSASVGVAIFSLAGATGNAQVQTNTFFGVPNTVGAGKTAYLYRVDLAEVVALGEFACITDMTINFGPITQLPYVRPGQFDDVFVITEGGIGSIGLLSAEQTSSGITFTFEKPICATQVAGAGESSFVFGLASATVPRSSQATLAQPGVEEELTAGTQAPALP